MDEESPVNEPETHKEIAGTSSSGIGAFWSELKRRHVVRIAMVYAIVAWLVIQIAATTFPSLYIPQWALSMVIMCVILGFPVALILAWAFELTPEGIKTTKAAQKSTEKTGVSESHAKKRGWLSLLFAAAVPTLIFGTLALFFFIRSDRQPAGSTEFDKSIAVLPFTNLSANQEHAFFADGVHETILTDLANLRDMRVVSRTSVMPYRGSDKSIITIGQELGVAYILEGSMQRAENAFRLTAQLIDARTDEHLWAKNFDGELTNIFSVQSQLAKDVAKGLHAVLSPQEVQQLDRAKSSSVEAYDLYLQALEILNADEYGYVASLVPLKQAVALDPTFTDAWLKIANVVGNRYFRGFQSPEDEQTLKRAIDMAVRLEPENPNVKVGLGLYFFRSQLDHSRARFHIEPVVEKLPRHIEALRAMGDISGSEGRFSEAVSHYERVHLLDPKLSRPLSLMRRIYDRHRDWRKRSEMLDKLIAIRNSGHDQFERALVEFLDRGSVEEANRVFADGYTNGVTENYHYHWLYASGNLQAFRDEGIIDSWKERAYKRQLTAENWIGAMQVVVLTLLDEPNFAMEVLDFLKEQAELMGNSANAQAALGFALAVAGDFEKAQTAIDFAVSTHPESADAGLGVAIAHRRAVALGWLGKKDEAVAELVRLSKKPNRFTSYYILKNHLDYLPLRDHPGFQELLNDPALKQPIPLRNW